jgi:hypothetical protein
MSMQKCPGQNQQFRTHEDICHVICPDCQSEIEFWKDKPYHIYCECNKTVKNPKTNTGCIQWSKHASECLTGIIK